MRNYIHSVIDGIGHYVPEKVVTNDDLSKIMDTSDNWIQSRTGIKERRIAELDVGTSDLAVLAAKDLFQKYAIDPKEIDLIIAATLSPDYYFPGIGVQIQSKLSLDVPAIDIRAQCSGFSWGISTVDAFIKSGNYKNVLLIGAEIHSRVLEYSHRARTVSVLFGDGAGATLIRAKESTSPLRAQDQERGVIDCYMGNDGSAAEKLAMLRPGMVPGQKDFITPQEAADRVYVPHMEGQYVFKNAVSKMSESAKILCERNEINLSDLSLVVTHQANIRIIDAVREKLSLPEEKMFNNIERYGNTTAASIPLCLSEAVLQNKLKEGDLIMLLAFGAGFTWGANLIRW